MKKGLWSKKRWAGRIIAATFTTAITFALVTNKKDLLRLFRISEPLKAAFKKQRQTVFGNKRYWLHIATWVAVGVIVAFSDAAKKFTQGFKKGSESAAGKVDFSGMAANGWNGWGICLALSLAMLMTYIYLLIIIPLARHKRQRRILWIGLIVNGLLYTLSLFIAGIIAGYTIVVNKRVDQELLMVLGALIIVSIMLSSYFFAIYYFIDLYDQQKELAKYKRSLQDKLEAESSFLKMQINPHFLFNTLNNIYSLTLSKSGHAVGTTQQLKHLLQYMLEDCAKDKVPVQGELDFISNYISLEQLRNKEEQVDIQLYISGNASHSTIAPLLLINFIENAFKHGVKADVEKAYVHINISIANHKLHLNITNSKPSHADTSMAVKQSGGIGIKNVKRRLEILYPKAHTLRISKTNSSYTVDIKIDLNDAQ